jgi:hypothetical protein
LALDGDGAPTRGGDIAEEPRMKALIVDEPWISLIISEKKTREMGLRNTPCEVALR